MFPKLKELFDSHLDGITAELLAVGILTRYVASDPSSNAIIKEFHNGFAFLETIQQVNERCHKFFSAMYKIEGNFTLAADILKKRLKLSLLQKFNVSLDL